MTRSGQDKASDAIAKIADTLALFEEGKWVRCEKRVHHEPGPFKLSEFPRLLIKAIREAGKPLTTVEITRAILEARNLTLDTKQDRHVMTRRVCSTINDKHRQGVLKPAGKVGNLTAWAIDADGENTRAQAFEALKAAKRDARSKRSAEIREGLRGR